MKIERITKEQAEVIARRFEEVLRATARRMGELTVKAENVKFALSEMSVTFSVKTSVVSEEFPHYVYDGFAEREGVEYGEHFVGSRYRVKVDKSYQIVTVTGVDFKARKYKVCIEIDKRKFRIAPAALRGNMLRDRPTWEDFALWCQYDGDDDRLIGDTVDRWDFTEVYMNKTFGVTRLSVLRELLERFRRTEPSPENVQDVADALKRLSMEPRSEALRIAVIEQLYMVRVIYEGFDRRVLTVRIEGAPEGAAKMVTKVCRGERFLDAEFVSVRKSGEVFFASWRLTSNKFPVLHVFEGVRYCLQQDINKRL